MNENASLNADELKAYKNAIMEITNSMTRIDAENELIADIAEVQQEKYGISKSDTKRVARIVHKQNLAEEQAKFEAISQLAESVLN